MSMYKLPQLNGMPKLPTLEGLEGMEDKNALTPYQQEVLPYVQRAQAERQKKDWWQEPLEVLFDLLSRGQYVSANAVQDIQRMIDPTNRESVNILEGIWKGVTGERKGTYKTTFFGGQDVGGPQIKGAFPQAANSPLKQKFHIPVISDIWGDTTGEDVIGFLGDVFLDPGTYVSFGATEGNKAAAGQYAKFISQQAAKQIGNLENLSRFVQKGFNVVKYEKLLKEGTEGALKHAKKYLGEFLDKKAVQRFMEDTYNTAFKKALKSSPKALQQEIVEALGKDKAKYMDELLEKVSGRGGQRTLEKTILALKESGEFANPQALDDILALAGSGKMTRDQMKTAFRDILESGANRQFAAEVGGDLFPKIPKPMNDALNALREYKKSFEQASRIPTEWRGAGERAVFFMGREFFKSTRQPWIVSRTWDAFKDYISKVNIPIVNKTLSDAAYAIRETGPIGFLRKTFGFRNPYQAMLHEIEMGSKHLMPHLADQAVNEVHELFLDKAITPDMRQKTIQILADAQKLQPEDITLFLRDPKNLAKYGIDEKELPYITNLYTRLKGISNKWAADEAAMGITEEYMSVYLPGVMQQRMQALRHAPRTTGTPIPAFAKHKRTLTMDAIAQEKAKFKALLGVSDETAENMVTKLNWSTTNLDIEEMFMARGVAHAQAMANATMIEGFRPFGIRIHGKAYPEMAGANFFDDVNPVDAEANKELFKMLSKKNADFSDIGLYRGADPRLSDYFFDKDVADIINKSVAITGSDEGIKGFLEKWNGVNALWRAYAVFTPGFTIRNAKNNTVTGVLHYGLGFLNPKRALESWVITAHGLGMVDDVAKKFNLKPRFVENILNKRYGGMTGREISEELSRRGIISKGSMMYDIPQYVRGVSKPKKLRERLNPFDVENVALSGARTVNSVVESTPKVTAFLMELEQMAGQEAATKGMKDFAAQQVKKYFFDYADLTPFEKNIMKNIFPFYVWVRKNLASQITNIVENRGYSVFPKIERAMSEEMTPEEQSNLPEYMQEQRWLKQGEGPEGVRMQRPNMFYEDINRIPLQISFNEQGMPEIHLTPKETWDEFMSMTSPALKSFAAMATGRDPFRQKDLDSTAPAPRALRFLTAHPASIAVIDALLKTVGIENGLNVQEGDNGELLIDGKIQYLLEANFPLLQRIDQMGDAVTEYIPQIESAVETATGWKKGYEGMANTFKVMSYLFGITQKDVDMSKQELYKYREILKEAEKEMKSNRERTPGYEKRTQEYAKREREKFRRLGLLR